MHRLTSERAARSKIRLDRDLDPGSFIVPLISLIGCSTISDTAEAFSEVVAIEAETLSAVGAQNPPILLPPTLREA